MREIMGWKGVLASMGRQERIIAFLVALSACVSICFLNLGFLAIEQNGDIIGYAIVLTGPIIAGSLLLGTVAGALVGGLGGAALLLHKIVQPLDPVEQICVSPLSSIVALTLVGLLSGMFFALVLRKGPEGAQRVIRLALGCLVLSTLSCLLFCAAVTFYVAVSYNTFDTAPLPEQFALTLEGMGGPFLGIGVPFAVSCLCVFATDAIALWYCKPRNAMRMNALLRVRLLIIELFAFLLVAATCFTAATYKGVSETEAATQSILDAVTALLNDVQGPDSKTAFPGGLNVFSRDVRDVVIVFEDGRVVFSNNRAYPLGMGQEEAIGGQVSLEELSSTGHTMRLPCAPASSNGPVGMEVGDLMTYNARNEDNVQLGYMRVAEVGDYVAVVLRPYSVAFAERRQAMLWATLTALVLIAIVYLLTTRLMRTAVTRPVERVNASLSKIAEGRFDEKVDERGSTEFSSLSDGINSMVVALEDYAKASERRIEEDLRTAKAIQEGALPRLFPPFPDIVAFDIYASMKAAKEVGGDFYDFFLVDEHTLGFLIADVSGKGIPAALFMMKAKTAIGDRMHAGVRLEDAITDANKSLCVGNDASMFVTVWAATLDWETGLLTYVNAGHCEPLLRHADACQWLRDTDGPLMGFGDFVQYRSRTITLEAGDELLLYTDGVTEAMDSDDDLFGEERLEALFAEHGGDGPHALIDSVRDGLTAWANGAEQSDDITMLALTYRGER